MYTNSFIPIFTSILFALYTTSISYEFNKVYKNINYLQNECRELRTELLKLKLKTNKDE